MRVVLTLQYSQERGESEAGGEVDGEDETEHGEGGDQIGNGSLRER